MKYHFSVYLFVLALLLTTTNSASAQTKEELQELMNSSSNTKGSATNDKKSSTNTTEITTKTAKEVKQKELPDPKKIGWRKNKKFGDKLTQRGSIYKAITYYQEALEKKPKKTFLNQNIADGNFALARLS